MPRLPRPGRPAVPDDVRVVPAAGERVLAWGRDQAGRAVVASQSAVYLPDLDGAYQRLSYLSIARAAWTDPLLEVVTGAPRQRRHVVDLAQPGEVPPTVRERVMATILLTERVPIVGDRGALVTARRVPGQDAPAWTVVFDAGLDPADPALRAVADAAIAALRATSGL